MIDDLCQSRLKILFNHQSWLKIIVDHQSDWNFPNSATNYAIPSQGLSTISALIPLCFLDLSVVAKTIAASDS